MDKLRLAAVLYLTLWGADAIRAQQFSRRSDPNLVLDAARAVGLRPARTGREPNTAPEGILPSGQDFGPRQPIQYAGRPDGLLDSLARTRDTDPNLYQAYREYLLAYLDGERRKIEEHRDVIASTNRMGTWVFVVVHVFLGLAMVIAVLSRIGLNPATDDRVKPSQCSFSFRTRSALAMQGNSRWPNRPIADGRRAGSLGSAAVREWALRELVGAWPPQAERARPVGRGPRYDPVFLS